MSAPPQVDSEVLSIVAVELSVLGLDLSQLPLPLRGGEGKGGLRLVDGGWCVVIPPSAGGVLERFSFYLHCLAHYLLRHHLRRPPICDQSKWDIAADYVANAFWFFLAKHFHTLPSRVKEAIKLLYPYRKEWRDKSVEEIYFLLVRGGEGGGRSKDSHEEFTYSYDLLSLCGEGEMSLREKLVFEAVGQALGGVDKGKTPLRAEFLPTSPPPALLYLLQQKSSIQEEETLDVVFLSYNKPIDVPISTRFVRALHLCDISLSMMEYINPMFSALQAVITTTATLWGQRSSHLVVVSDVVVRGVWAGVDYDLKLKELVSHLVGLGGTLIFKAIRSVVENFNIFDFAFIYSDLQLAESDLTHFYETMQQLKNTFKVLIAPPHYNSVLRRHFDEFLPLTAFLRRD